MFRLVFELIDRFLEASLRDKTAHAKLKEWTAIGLFLLHISRSISYGMLDRQFIQASEIFEAAISLRKQLFDFVVLYFLFAVLCKPNLEFFFRVSVHSLR